MVCSSNPGVGEIFFLSLALFCFTLLLARLSNHLKSPVPVRLGKGCSTCCCQIFSAGHYNNSNIDDFKEVLSCVSWEVIDFENSDIELPWSQWKDLFFSAQVDYVFPSVRWNKRKMKHWFSESTIKLIHRKNIYIVSTSVQVIQPL